MEHPVIALAQENQDSADLKDWSEMLYEQSILAEGGKLEDPSGFIKRMNEMMLKLSGA
jgi:molecular chaperone HtpG